MDDYHHTNGQSATFPYDEKYSQRVMVEDEEDTARAKDRLLAEPGASEHVPMPRDLGESGGEDRVVKLNVGGRVFMTRQTTLFNTHARAKGLKLADRDFLAGIYDVNRDEFFLDRDPEVFACLLNFLRSGHLHLPPTLCGPHVKEELAFYGVSPMHIEPCCWSTFNTWTSVIASLRRLERDSKIGVATTTSQTTSACASFRLKVWRTLTNPRYSLWAKIYGWIALLFAMLAIFSFCAATHVAFRIPKHSNTSSSFPPSPSVSPTLTSQNVSNVTTTTSSPTQTRSPRKIEDMLSETVVHPALWYLDLVCFIFFAAEYIIKIICAPRKRRYLRSINGLIDALALFPDLVEIIVWIVNPNDPEEESVFLLLLSFLRLMRVFRIFRLVRHIPGLWVMVYTLQASFRELFLMLVFLCVGTLLFSSVIFLVDDKKMFPSIPQSFWWAIVTMTTVGYGDMYPVTVGGYILGSMTAISGVLLIGFTVPALVNNFCLYYQHVQFALERDRLRKELEKEDEEEKENEEKKARTGDGLWESVDLNGGKSSHEHIPLADVKNGHH